MEAELPQLRPLSTLNIDCHVNSIGMNQHFLFVSGEKGAQSIMYTFQNKIPIISATEEIINDSLKDAGSLDAHHGIEHDIMSLMLSPYISDTPFDLLRKTHVDEDTTHWAMRASTKALYLLSQKQKHGPMYIVRRTIHAKSGVLGEGMECGRYRDTTIYDFAVTPDDTTLWIIGTPRGVYGDNRKHLYVVDLTTPPNNWQPRTTNNTWNHVSAIAATNEGVYIWDKANTITHIPKSPNSKQSHIPLKDGLDPNYMTITPELLFLFKAPETRFDYPNALRVLTHQGIGIADLLPDHRFNRFARHTIHTAGQWVCVLARTNREDGEEEEYAVHIYDLRALDNITTPPSQGTKRKHT